MPIFRILILQELWVTLDWFCSGLVKKCKYIINLQDLVQLNLDIFKSLLQFEYQHIFLENNTSNDCISKEVLALPVGHYQVEVFDGLGGG